jgi:cobalt/nickel transport system permease protein
MPGPDVFPLWAVHISDGALSPWWAAGGFALAGLLALFGAWRIRDEEIPRVAVLASAFFVASLIHVRVPPTSVHLLLNGLVGVVLGRRAALAIPVGLFLQAVLIGHGGLSALGVNSCVMVLPALAAALLFDGLRRLPWLRRAWFRAGLILLAAPLWLLSLVYTAVLLVSNLASGRRLAQLAALDTDWANRITLHPATVLASLAFGVVAVLLERRLRSAPEFALGLLVGGLSVLATVLLNSLVLLFGSLNPATGSALSLVLFACHLPIVVIEGVIVGFLVGFLARVKPEMLGWSGDGVPAAAWAAAHPDAAERNGAAPHPVLAERAKCSADPLP